MYNYAQLNESNIVVGISQLSNKVDLSNMILLESYDTSLLGATYDEESGEFVPAPPPEPVPQGPDPIEQLQAENAALMMQVAQLEAKNEQQAGDTAFLILKNAELEAQATQTAQEQASLLMELTMKGVI
ncbi:hypothetical protein [Aneurinibacillus aneurinilyticus]|uniref:Uncharacterized protein n=1 Tax=Aneurinibacillus aneurinilyticus TaxID=1391 RepID=A0A848D5L3_ANEAE|nr:hypothetical protein [Aneurinibacillus aneurinilyticus]NMF01487.1 hypothetical protein [Aneurinibacillus aneurinilyticus]